MKVSNLVVSERKLEVRVGPAEEDVVKITYRPGALTLGIADQLQALQFDPLADLRVAEAMLLPLVSDWDLQAEDGTQLDVDTEVLKTLPIEFISKIFTAIREDATVDPQRAETLEDGSPQTEQREGSLSGIGS